MPWCDECSHFRADDPSEPCECCGAYPDDVDSEAGPKTCDNCGGDADDDDGPEAGHDTPGGWWCRRCVAIEEGEEE